VNPQSDWDSHRELGLEQGLKPYSANNDSSVRADCQWSNADYLINNNTDVLPKVAKKVGVNKGELQDRPDKGKLPGNVPEPLFVADPNHRRKGLTGELIALDKSRVKLKLTTMTRMDSTTIGKNFGYMARQLRNLADESMYENSAKAVLEHHFDNHLYCGAWCRRKDETEEQRKRSKKYYRNKVESQQLYDLLQSKLERFITLDRLREIAHGMDTNMNEAFNNVCTWFAPKNKVFCGTGSLSNRLSMAASINSVGMDVFFSRLYEQLGIYVTPNVTHFLKLKEKSRFKRLATIRTRDFKVNKNKAKHVRQAADTVIAKIEARKRAGTYRRGMNVDDSDEDNNDPLAGLLAAAAANPDEGARKPAAKKRKAINYSGIHCQYCGVKGHVTKKSRSCTAPLDSNKKFKNDGSALVASPNKAADIAAIPAASVEGAVSDTSSPASSSLSHRDPVEDDADDIDAEDSNPWDFGDPVNPALEEDNDSGFDHFEDAETWSSDEEDIVDVIGVRGLGFGV
jgi:hypothetical protein